MTVTTHETTQKSIDQVSFSEEMRQFLIIAQQFGVERDPSEAKRQLLDQLVAEGDPMVQAELMQLGHMYENRSESTQKESGARQRFVLRGSRHDRVEDEFQIYWGDEGHFRAECTTDFGHPEDLRYRIAVADGECRVLRENYHHSEQKWVEQTGDERDALLRDFYRSTIEAFNTHQERSDTEREVADMSARELQQRLDQPAFEYL